MLCVSEIVWEISNIEEIDRDVRTRSNLARWLTLFYTDTKIPNCRALYKTISVDSTKKFFNFPNSEEIGSVCSVYNKEGRDNIFHLLIKELFELKQRWSKWFKLPLFDPKILKVSQKQIVLKKKKFEKSMTINHLRRESNCYDLCLPSRGSGFNSRPTQETTILEK